MAISALWPCRKSISVRAVTSWQMVSYLSPYSVQIQFLMHPAGSNTMCATPAITVVILVT